MTDHRDAGGGLAVAVVDARLALPACRPDRGGLRVAEEAHDEDVVTLASMAVLGLERAAGPAPRALLLATTSSPLAEGGVAQVVAEICGLAGPGLHVGEHCGGVAAGLGVLSHAAGLVAAGLGPVVVVAADVRRDRRGRPLGAGAVALVLAAEGEVATLRWLGSHAVLHRDAWRPGGAPGVVDGDRDLARAHDPWRDPPWDPAAVHDAIRCGPRTPTLDGAGALGCAAPMAAALTAAAGAAPGDRLGIASSAGGVAHALEMVLGPDGPRTGRAIREVLAGGVTTPPPRRSAAAEGFAPFTSGPRAFRERGMDLRLEGQRDTVTGEVRFPPVPASSAAGLVPHVLARRGRVLTMTTDHVYPHGGPVQMAVVDLDDGGRFYGQAVPECPALSIGEEVSLVPRRLHVTDGLAQYHWKVAPAPAAAGRA